MVVSDQDIPSSPAPVPPSSLNSSTAPQVSFAEYRDIPEAHDDNQVINGRRGFCSDRD